MSKRIILAEGKLAIDTSWTMYDRHRMYIGGNTALSDYAMLDEILKKFKEQDGKNVKLILEVK